MGDTKKKEVSNSGSLKFLGEVSGEKPATYVFRLLNAKAIVAPKCGLTTLLLTDDLVSLTKVPYQKYTSKILSKCS